MSETRAPRVSVLMSVYNGERYVRAAVESILAQTFGDFEFLVVDDGSTDGTAAILASFDDSRLRVLSQANAGLAASLNRAAGQARGEYLARMDADDVSWPERLAVQVAYLDAHAEVDVVGAYLEYVDEAGRALGVKRVVSHPAVIRRFLLVGNCVPHPTVVMRRRVWEEGSGYREELSVAQDYDLWTRLLGRVTFAALPRPLLRYRRHEAQVSVEREEVAAATTRDIQGRAWRKVTAEPPPIWAGFAAGFRAARDLGRTIDRDELGFVLPLHFAALASACGEALRRGHWRATMAFAAEAKGFALGAPASAFRLLATVVRARFDLNAARAALSLRSGDGGAEVR